MRSLYVLLGFGCCLAFADAFPDHPYDQQCTGYPNQIRHASRPHAVADNDFRIKEQLTERWNVDLSAFVNASVVYYYYYSENGLLWGEFSQTWDGNNFSNGEGDFYNLYTYNQNGVLIESLQQTCINGDWVNQYHKTVIDYRDELNYQEIGETWANSAWRPSNRTTSSVDSASRQVSNLQEIWDGAEWRNDYLFLSPMIDTTVIAPVSIFEARIWNDTVKAWIGYERRVSTTTSDSTDELVVQTWQNGEYTDLYRVLYRYSNRNLDFYEKQNWTENSWQPASRNFFYYDERGLLVEDQSQTFYENDWICKERWLYQYDAYGNPVLMEVMVWKPYPGVWGNDMRITNRYESVTRARKDRRSLPLAYSLGNYPNPFNSSTTVEVMAPRTTKIELAVFNTLGQKCRTLFTGRLPAGLHRFDLKATDLPAGSYLLRLQHEDGRLVRMMQLVK